MAVTQKTYTGNGSSTNYNFEFPYLDTTDIKVSLNGTITTAYTFANAQEIKFNTAPDNGVAIKIYRQTDDSALAATFYPGSAIRSQDLNDNFKQNLYVTQETRNFAESTDSAVVADVANLALSTAQQAESIAQQAIILISVPAGSVIYTARSTAPTGWLKANGALVSRTTYSDLFQAIGTTYGAGDGATTFALPDLRGEFIRGWDDSRGVDSGRSLGTAQLDALQNHDHYYQKQSSSQAAFGSGSVVASSSSFQQPTLAMNGRSANETRPRNVALLACIKY